MAGVIFSSQAWGNFGLRLGDDEESVLHRRKALAESLSLKKLFFMNQTHSDQIVLVRESTEESAIDADAIISTTKGVGVAVLVGDCLPILLKSDACVAAVHAGRAGMVNQIAAKTVVKMRELGATSIEAMIGPSICADCYEVSPEMYEEIVQFIPASATTEESHALNLQAGIASQLTELGVEVLNLGICTQESHEFFSHRRSLSRGEAEGRQVGVIFL